MRLARWSFVAGNPLRNNGQHIPIEIKKRSSTKKRPLLLRKKFIKFLYFKNFIDCFIITYFLNKDRGKTDPNRMLSRWEESVAIIPSYQPAQLSQASSSDELEYSLPCATKQKDRTSTNEVLSLVQTKVNTPTLFLFLFCEFNCQCSNRFQDIHRDRKNNGIRWCGPQTINGLKCS